MTRISKHLMRAFTAVALALVVLSAGAHAATRNFALPHYLANPGGTVEVPLTLDNASGLAAIRVRINFDPEVLELQSVSAGPLGKAFELSHGKRDGVVQLLLFRAGSLAGGSGRLAVLKFRANPGAKAKAFSDLAIADVGLSDSSGVINLRQKDSLRLTNGQVAVTLSPNINNSGSGLPEWWKELHALSGLSLSTGSLSTDFSSSVLNYTASVANTVTSIKVKPTLADPNAKVKVNGVLVTSGSSSAAIPLKAGSNSITTQVIAQNGTSVKTYTVTVNRAPSSVATLSGLSLSTGNLNPDFSSSVVTYTTSVANTVTSINVKPTLTDPTAKVKVNGVLVTAGSSSAAIPLTVGSNSITTQVTAQNGTSVKTYTIEVTRKESPDSSDKTLSGLVVKSVTLSPKFKRGTTRYTASVPLSKKSVRIRATATHDASKIKINGTKVKSGTLSTAIPLKTGKNVIKIVVTARNGSSKTYKIIISRTRSLSAPATPNSLAAAMIRPLRESIIPRESLISKMVLGGKNYLQLTIRRNPGTPKPVVEVSPNLVDWFSGNRHTTTIVDDGRLLIVRDNTPIQPGEKRFIRVRK